MRRTLALSVLILTITMTTTPALATTPSGPCTGFHVERSDPRDHRVAKMKALIRCVFDAVGIPGQTSTALSIAERESGFYPWAKNPMQRAACRPYSGTVYGSCGLFQHLARYWIGRARTFLPRDYFPHKYSVGPLNQRANVWVTARMVRAGGWGPWS